MRLRRLDRYDYTMLAVVGVMVLGFSAMVYYVNHFNGKCQAMGGIAVSGKCIQGKELEVK